MKEKTALTALKFKAVPPGSTLGLIAVSAPTERVRFERAVDWIHAQGYKTRTVLEPWREYGNKRFLFSSDDAKVRAAALHELFADPVVAAIVTVRGAYGCMEILPELDFKLIRKHPKPIVGFSDVTALLLAIYKHSGLLAFHGPSVESAARAHEGGERENNLRALFAYLSGAQQNPFEGFKLKPIKGGATAEGEILAGNLSIFASLMGTKYEPDFSGHIVCFEESGERPFRIHRMLLQMKLAGKFDRVAGVVLGSFHECVHPKGLGPNVEDVTQDIFRDFEFPVLGAAPFGHSELNRPVALGVRARIAANNLEFIEVPVLK